MKCERCLKEFRYASELARHLSRKTICEAVEVEEIKYEKCKYCHNLLYYLEYNSTINCSFIFSGICSLCGRVFKTPSILSIFQVIHSCVVVFCNEDSIDESDFDFSLTPFR